MHASREGGSAKKRGVGECPTPSLLREHYPILVSIHVRDLDGINYNAHYPFLEVYDKVLPSKANQPGALWWIGLGFCVSYGYW